MAIFQRFLANHEGDTRQELLEAMMELRAEFAISHAVRGFGMDMEKALELIRGKKKGLTKLQREQRDALIAAIDNLVDFAVAEEFHMIDDLPEDIDTEDPAVMEECEGICKKYNKVYAGIENGDITHAMWIAAWFIARSDKTVLTYMTQGDERVRPWHRALEGISYSKRNFPAWMIPPIEHGCRCYLVEESAVAGIDDTAASSSDIPDFVNPVFAESVAKGGRIFGPAHSYFSVPANKKKKLRRIANKIKKQWLKK